MFRNAIVLRILRNLTSKQIANNDNDPMFTLPTFLHPALPLGQRLLDRGRLIGLTKEWCK